MMPIIDVVQLAELLLFKRISEVFEVEDSASLRPLPRSNRCTCSEKALVKTV